MKNTIFAVAAAATLAGCADHQKEMYPQDWFITATQDRVDWVLTTIEVLEAWTTDEPNCFRNDIARWVSDLLETWDDRENVDVCFFPNEEANDISEETIPIS